MFALLRFAPPDELLIEDAATVVREVLGDDEPAVPVQCTW